MSESSQTSICLFYGLVFIVLISNCLRESMLARTFHCLAFLKFEFSVSMRRFHFAIEILYVFQLVFLKKNHQLGKVPLQKLFPFTQFSHHTLAALAFLIFLKYAQFIPTPWLSDFSLQFQEALFQPKPSPITTTFPKRKILALR